MKFDKSKVCVAGLHEVKEGTKGWMAVSIDELEENVTANGCLYIMKGQRNCLYVDEVNTVWRFFYPAPEQQYRPFETIKEAQVMKGKWIRSKTNAEFFMVTNIRVDVLTGMLFLYGISAEYLFDDFVMDETGEPVGVEE